MAGIAVEKTIHALNYFGPSLLNQKYWDASVPPKGGWLPRLQAAPGPGRTSATDPHIAGRALDIILFASDANEKDYADRIVQVFLGLKAKMSFIAVIYNGWEWNGAGIKFAHKDEAHKTHIHIEWSGGGVSNSDFASDLEDALYNEFSGGNISSGDYATA